MNTIKNKFILAGTVVCLSVFGVLALEQYKTHKLQMFNVISYGVSEVGSGMLMQRRNEKDFLARKDLKYKEKFKKNFAVLEKRVTFLEDAVAYADLDIAQIGKLKKELVSYKSSFLDLVAIQEKIGLHSKDGLYGSLRQAVHLAEADIKKLGDDQLRADMLQLRRNEKDFMLRLDLKYLTKFTKNMAIFSQHLSESSHSPASKGKVLTHMRGYQQDFEELVTNSQLKGLNSEEGVLGEMRSIVHETEAVLKQVSNRVNGAVEEEDLDTFTLINDAIAFILVMLVIAVLVWLAIGILRPIRDLAGTMTKAANDNDLTLRMTIKTQDEIGETNQAFNNMLETFQASIAQVNSSSAQIAIASEQMSAVTLRSTQGMRDQQSQTGQLATGMSRMIASVQEVSKSADEAVNGAAEVRAESDRGHEVVSSTTKTIKSLSESISRASTAIQKVEGDSEQVGTVLEVIRGVADQTNLLALNAAIEAARAGEHGRGFAVVADEVRTLASRTQGATEEIQKMIESLQVGASRAVKLMDESREFSQNGVEQTLKVGEALTSIISGVSSIHEMNNQISSAAKEQEGVSQEINRNVVSINEIASQTAEGASDADQASGDLDRLAVALQVLVAEFKT